MAAHLVHVVARLFGDDIGSPLPAVLYGFELDPAVAIGGLDIHCKSLLCPANESHCVTFPIAVCLRVRQQVTGCFERTILIPVFKDRVKRHVFEVSSPEVVFHGEVHHPIPGRPARAPIGSHITKAQAYQLVEKFNGPDNV